MDGIAGWVAPIATTVAAMMTASNLGTRVTGWGFVIFSLASAAWIIVAVSTDQDNLLLSNAFLMIVNVVGIWRWLGRQATYDKGANAAELDSENANEPDLIQLSAFPGKPLMDARNKTVGHVVDAMAETETGRISYLVVRAGSEATLRERLHALSWQNVSIDQDAAHLVDMVRLEDTPEIDPAHWPRRAPEAL